MSKEKDRIRELIPQMKEHEKDLKNHIKKILLKKQILEHGGPFSGFKCSLQNPDSDGCFFGCEVPEGKNTLGKPISVIIKPDHDPNKRVLRVVIQVDSEAPFMEKEVIDKEKWSASEVFKKEEKEIEEDIEEYFSQRKAA